MLPANVSRLRKRERTMLADLEHNERLSKYRQSIPAGQTLFTEGDDSQDLYILAGGSLDVLKGSKRIAEISGAGVFFGEMSFLLQSRRTSTVRARTDVAVFRIPSGDIDPFSRDFPDIALVVLKQLAQKLDETSQVLYGFKEFCDRLPEAVIMTGRDGAIISWNRAAEELYGGDWTARRQQPAEALFASPAAYREHLQEVQRSQRPQEKVLEIKGEGGGRFVAASSTMLYDGHHNYQGMLSLCRDVTASQSLKSKYRFATGVLAPALVAAGLLLAAVFYGYPYFSSGKKAEDLRKAELRSQLARDYLVLSSLLAEPLGGGDREKIRQVLQDFCLLQKGGPQTYVGVVLLDRDKKVYDSCTPAGSKIPPVAAGSTYGGIPFQGGGGSMHRVLSLYRAAPGEPMGTRGVEVAFELGRTGQEPGWLVFQLDTAALENMYGATEEDLLGFRFEKPRQ